MALTTILRRASGLLRCRALQMPLPQRCCRHFSSGEGSKITSGGFSYPAPRSLQQIVKLELLENESQEQIRAIWENYHREKDDSLATTLASEQYANLVQRATASPFFLFPVYRKEGFFNMICQFQDTCFLLTYLEAFKENPGLAPPCLTVSLYDDLVENKQIGLLRADVINMLDKKESQVLLDQLVASYSDEKLFAWVHRFNHEPEQFDFEAYRLEMQKYTAALPSTESA
uniref:ATP synthase mitochondrial F1 complex assembly factor 1 n=1 Tax=Globisporangium ultimum (strain ATCC 200006 / CBS 805.95 / DAOM BR144) TaxID=431595 RepID=K3X797_GLOUD